jgi:hypothetical protein
LVGSNLFSATRQKRGELRGETSQERKRKRKKKNEKRKTMTKKSMHATRVFIQALTKTYK